MFESIVPGQLDPQLKVAVLLAHASLGRRLLPTNWVQDGRCSCMQREKPGDKRLCSRSNKIGKHPRISAWQNQATCDEDKILEWHQWLPLANWGWVQDQTFTLDVDPKRDGLISLSEWEEEAGGPPHTMTQRTPSGGWHFIYRQPKDAPITVQGDIMPGIEIRGVGSYIMLWPSTGLDGAWELVDPDVQPVEADELTLALVMKHGIDVEGWVNEKTGKTSKTGKKSSGKSSDLPATEHFLERGFGAHSGSRNVDAYRLAWRLLRLGDRYPEVWTTAYITGVFQRCWRVTEQGAEPFEWDECLGALKSAWLRKTKQDKEDHAALVARAQRLLGSEA